ncbi:MAG: site-2 protease family protein [Blastocatellia bacterium]|nr:site-2 protease family protein [Blastocatellia bacterium]
MESTNQPYLLPEPNPSQPLLDEERTFKLAREEELSPSRVRLHIILLGVTCVTTTLTGAAWSIKAVEPPDLVLGSFLAPLIAALRQTAAGNFDPLANGLIFTFTLLTILGAHEFGHYFACRYYRVRATLPFFIPAPPFITPFGTFGAVIKIKEPIRSRRALFDIGIAGPLAGFALALPASVIGLVFAKEAAPATGGMQFHDPLLFRVIMKMMGLPQWMEWNPVYWAAWAALLVTALNLFPVGQLDGGHVLYAATGRRIHKWVSLITCLAVGTLAVLSFVWYDSPIWFLWTLVLLFLLRVGHPPVFEEEPLGKVRIILAVLAALVFLLCFMPFPITIS